MNDQHEQDHVLGNIVQVSFSAFGGNTVEGKIDTGATTSSLHAENIQVNKHNNTVSFTCEELSNKVITMQLDGAQEVVSADAGGNTRPVVKFDIEIDGVLIKAASFNLNDRSEMDSPILIGQNVLKAGHFIIDVNKDSEQASIDNSVEPSVGVDRNTRVREAIEVLTSNNVTLLELIGWLTPPNQ